jgi:hypothetical protein
MIVSGCTKGLIRGYLAGVRANHRFRHPRSALRINGGIGWWGANRRRSAGARLDNPGQGTKACRGRNGSVLFSGLALYTVFGGTAWSVLPVRLCVDTGLLLIVLISMAVGRPFTLQCAREQVAPEFWDRPEFVRTNYVITAVGALAFCGGRTCASLCARIFTTRGDNFHLTWG